MISSSDIGQAVARAHANAPFLSGLIDRDPALVSRLEMGQFDLAPITTEGNVARSLRHQRRAVALSVAIGDLAGVFDLTEVTRRLTAFADQALDAAIRAAIAERTPGAEPRGFAAIALGKQGSCELNYSSDIDPILLFDPATLPRRPREEPEDAAVRIGRRVVELLQARNADGYVLRVDLRLRPSPEITPIVLPVGAAISYYESQALAWERAAFYPCPCGGGRCPARTGIPRRNRTFRLAPRTRLWCDWRDPRDVPPHSRSLQCKAASRTRL